MVVTSTSPAARAAVPVMPTTVVPIAAASTPSFRISSVIVSTTPPAPVEIVRMTAPTVAVYIGLAPIAPISVVVTVIATAPAGAVVVAIAAAPASLVIVIAFTPATSVGIVPTATTWPFLRAPIIAITPASAVIAHVARALTVTPCQMMLARPRRLLGKPALLDIIKAAVKGLGRISDLG